MGRHAIFIDEPAEIHVCGTVVAGAHRPITAALGVPTHRHLQESPVGGTVKERSRVIARTYDVIGLKLEDVAVFAVESDLVTPLIEFPAALHHRVMTAGRFVKQV